MPGGYCEAASKQSAAQTELDKGAALHKQGALSEAAEHYGAALDALEIPWRQVADSQPPKMSEIAAHYKALLDALDIPWTQVQNSFASVLTSCALVAAPLAFKDVPKDAVVSDALHWLGAVRVLQVSNSDTGEEDEEENHPDGSPVRPVSITKPKGLKPEKICEVNKWLIFLRAAVDALPDNADAAKRGRALNSVGTAALLLRTAANDEEALAVLREAVRLVPSSWPAWVNMLKVLRRKVQQIRPREDVALNGEIASALEQMAQLRPQHPGVFYRLGLALKKIRQTEKAIVSLERQLTEAEAFASSEAQAKNNSSVAVDAFKVEPTRHWLAVMKGENTATAPPQYVAKLFDTYAAKFEHHLVKELQYNTPNLIATDLGKLGTAADSWKRAADLGCGTGLMCPPLRSLGFQGHLEGVDLSEAMLLQAVKKGGPSSGYARLLCGDNLNIFVPAQEVLLDADGHVQVEKATSIHSASPHDDSSGFDLVVAADVFVYIGDLEPTFKKVAQWLNPGGIFAFSTEALAADDSANYRLNDTARYTHARSYIDRLARDSELQICSTHDVVLRMNAGEPVRGHVHVFRQPSNT